MQHRHLVAERAAQPAHRLRRQTDLRHEHDGPPAAGQPPLHRLEVHQRLPASGDPEQQGTRPRRQLLDRGDRPGLRGGEGRGRRCAGSVAEGIAHPLGGGQPREPLRHEAADHRLAEAELLDDVAHLSAPAQGLERLVQLAPAGAPFEERGALQQRGRLALERHDPLGGRRPRGVRGLHPEAHRAHRGQAVDRVPHRPAEGPRQQRDAGLAAARLQPVQHLARQAPDAPPARRAAHDDLRLPPQSGGEHRLEREAERGAVVLRHPARGGEQPLGHRGQVVGRGQDVARGRFRRGGVGLDDDPDQLPPANRHDHARAGGHPVGQRLGNAVGVRGGERERECDGGEALGHLRRTPSPGPEGSATCPPSMLAPTKGSSASRAAPSRSTMSTRGVK